MIQPATDLECSFRIALGKAHLKATGWSYRSAAVELGCSFTQLAHVLTGRRQSRSLVSRITALPQRP